jgi:hypothetical protein
LQAELLEEIRRAAISRRVSMTDGELKCLVAKLKIDHGLPHL